MDEIVFARISNICVNFSGLSQVMVTIVETSQADFSSLGKCR